MYEEIEIITKDNEPQTDINVSEGLSAYEIALKNGFTGTEKEWLESLKGKDGKDGKDGVDGKNGIDGATPDLSEYAKTTYVDEKIGDIDTILATLTEVVE